MTNPTAEKRYFSDNLLPWRKQQLAKINELKETAEGRIELRRKLDDILSELDGLDLSKEEDARLGAARLIPDAHTWLIGLLRDAIEGR